MLSHLAMKLFYVKMDTEHLEAEDKDLNGKIEKMKSDIINLKIENMELHEEKDVLTDKAGMIANTDLLKDFKATEDDFDKTTNSNQKLFSKIKYFYDM